MRPDYDDPGYDDYLDAAYEDKYERQYAAKVRRAEHGSPDYYELTDEEEE